MWGYSFGLILNILVTINGANPVVVYRNKHYVILKFNFYYFFMIFKRIIFDLPWGKRPPGVKGFHLGPGNAGNKVQNVGCLADNHEYFGCTPQF